MLKTADDIISRARQKLDDETACGFDVDIFSKRNSNADDGRGLLALSEVIGKVISDLSAYQIQSGDMRLA